MRLALVLTARCNASCAHCARSYGPNRSEHLDQTEIFRLMDEAAAIDDGENLYFDLTGGEPFLDFELLVATVSHGARLGAEVSCVTNAFWARTNELTRSKLETLRDAGLSALSVSVSRFHQRFVPLERARRALTVAAELGFWTEIKGAVTRHDLQAGGALETWKDSLKATCSSIFAVLPHIRNGETLPDEEYYRELGLPMYRCPGDLVSVDFEGVARSCCTLDGSNTFLVIGDARRMSLEKIHEAFQQGGKQRILRESGPIEFARGAIDAGLGNRLRKAYAGPCDLCLHIQSDPALRQVAEEMARAVEEQADCSI
ncbi:MAG: radical SAM protein [Steroidobacteraceae bacterium]